MAGYSVDFAFSCYDYYHGPEAPGAGWQLVGEGPRGGKVWAPPDERKEAPRPPSQDEPATPKNRIESSTPADKLTEKVKHAGGSGVQAQQVLKTARMMYEQDKKAIKETNEIRETAIKLINDNRQKSGLKPIQGKKKKLLDELDYNNQKEVPGYDKIAETISNLYPGHFHGFAGSAVLADAVKFDKTTSEALDDGQKLWDIIGKGQQQLPSVYDYYHNAYDEWVASNPKLKAGKPPYQPVNDSPLSDQEQRALYESLPATAPKGNTASVHRIISGYRTGTTAKQGEEFADAVKKLNIYEIWVLRHALGIKEGSITDRKADQVNLLLHRAGLGHHAAEPQSSVPFSEDVLTAQDIAISAWVMIDGTVEELEALLKAASGFDPFAEKFFSFAEPASRYIAPTGKGKKADDRDALFSLMQTAMKTGAERMGKYFERSLRYIGIERALRSGVLFTEEDRASLQADLASAIATADLLGRARVRFRAEAARKKHPSLFSEVASRFSIFDEPGKKTGQAPKNVSLLTPLEAYDYFTNLVPTLNVHPDRFGEMMERRAFTLAVATERSLLDEIQSVIADSIRDGEPGGAITIRQLMIECGVAPKNPQYAEAVYRTNVMDAAAIGHDREMATDDMRETFPVFEYSAITGDGRGRPWHVSKNGLLYPSKFLFTNVRGTSGEDVINCRCTPIAIDKWELADRLERGETIQASY
jgi:hypothetical protein